MDFSKWYETVETAYENLFKGPMPEVGTTYDTVENAYWSDDPTMHAERCATQVKKNANRAILDTLVIL